MTRKDYEAIAAVLAEARRHADHHWPEPFRHGRIAAIDWVAIGLADVLEANNPRFDRGRFLTAARA